MNPADGRVVSNFIVQALTGQPLTIYGEGQQTRSFCYVDDVLEGCVRLMATPDDVTGPRREGVVQEVADEERLGRCPERRPRLGHVEAPPALDADQKRDPECGRVQGRARCSSSRGAR
jgi:UDP-glucuronate decarboxylase